MFNEEYQRQNFKDHIATFTDYGNVKILDFKNPNSNHYRIRFLFEEDFYRLHISGDLGELIAVNYNNMVYDRFSDFVNNIGYFREKVVCHNRHFYNYEHDKAEKDLTEILKALDYYEDELEEKVDEILEHFYDEGLSNSETAYKLLSEIDSDCFEYIDTIGRESSGILELYMLAFKMAKEQLKEKANE